MAETEPYLLPKKGNKKKGKKKRKKEKERQRNQFKRRCYSGGTHWDSLLTVTPPLSNLVNTSCRVEQLCQNV